MKKIPSTVVVALMVCASSVSGGEIFGTISRGLKPAGAGLGVQIKMGAKTYPEAKTDELGRYHVYVAEVGPCTVTVHFDSHETDPLDIESYATSVRFDLAIENKDGKYVLRRR
jgi:hypothetical protein